MAKVRIEEINSAKTFKSLFAETIEKINYLHYPAGSPRGGQFAPKNGAHGTGGGGGASAPRSNGGSEGSTRRLSAREKKLIQGIKEESEKLWEGKKPVSIGRDSDGNEYFVPEGSKYDPNNAPLYSGNSPEFLTGGTKEKVQFISHDTVKPLDPKGFNERAKQKAEELKQLQKYEDMGDVGENLEAKRAEVNKSIDITSRNLEDGYPPPLTKEPYNKSKALKESGGTEDQVKEANIYAQEIGKYWESKEEGHDKTREQEVTEAVVKASVESGGKMFGLEAREKTETSLTRKIVKDKVAAERKGEDVGALKDIANSMKDAVRYTTVFDDADFTEGYERTKQKLAELGYREYRCKNMFTNPDNPTQAVQSVFGKFNEKTGEWEGLFELQFQTPSTQGAKNLSHEMYDKSREPNISEEKKKEYDAKTIELYGFSTIPPGVENIPERKAEKGWKIKDIVS